MFLYILRWIRGMVYLRFSGDLPERMLTALSHNRINFWGIKRFGKEIQICLAPKDMRKLRPIRRQFPVAVHIKGRRGLPFILRRYRFRHGLFLGFVLFLTINSFASTFVWNIAIEGNRLTSDKEIISMLGEIGIYEGIPKKRVNCDTARLKLSALSKSISWASLTIEGSRLTVAVNEREGVSPADPSPCNLVASRNGVVDDIYALTGVIKVKTGETVLKGQILVSGVVEYTTGENRLVAAKGEVFALTTHDLKITVPFKQTVTQRTGKTHRRGVISFFGLKVPLFIGSVKFPHQKVCSEHFVSANGSYLPIKYYDAVFYETQQVGITLTQEAAREKALAEMEKKCLELDCEILEYEDSLTESGDELTLRRHLTARENIAVPKKIQIEGGKSR